jgi:hypothetical protein
MSTKEYGGFIPPSSFFCVCVFGLRDSRHSRQPFPTIEQKNTHTDRETRKQNATLRFHREDKDNNPNNNNNNQREGKPVESRSGDLMEK